MKLPFFTLPSGRAPRTSTHAGDDGLGRGMDLALTVLVFLGIGFALDRWLGLFPLLTISLVLFAAVGSFVRMKLVYDATMERLEAEHKQSRHGASASADHGSDARSAA